MSSILIQFILTLGLFAFGRSTVSQTLQTTNNTLIYISETLPCFCWTYACTILDIEVFFSAPNKTNNIAQIHVVTTPLENGTLKGYTYNLFWKGRHTLYSTDILDQPVATGEKADFSFEFSMKDFFPPGDYTFYVILLNEEGMSACCGYINFKKLEAIT